MPRTKRDLANEAKRRGGGEGRGAQRHPCFCTKLVGHSSRGKGDLEKELKEFSGVGFRL